MRKEVFSEKGAPPAGIYSQGIVASGPTVYISGQGPRNPQTGEIAPDFRGQAVQVFENLKVLLEAAGTDWAHVTKTGVYLANLSDFAEMNEVYETYLTKPYPARTTVGVQLPNILIEVDVIAVLPER